MKVMRHLGGLVAFIGLCMVPGSVEQFKRASVREVLRELPLYFEANQGQAEAEVKFIARSGDVVLLLTPTEAELVYGESSPITMKFLAARSNVEIAGRGPLPGTVSYFVGDDPQHWHTRIPRFAGVEYRDIYPGIDLVYHGDRGQLEYDFVVSPGADPGRIQLVFDGVEPLSLTQDGDLVLKTRNGEVRQKRPYLYQVVDGRERPVAGRYVLEGENRVSFQADAYDVSQLLVIDPVLVYARLFGSRGFEVATGIAVDPAGNAYLTGFTRSLSANAKFDAFVARVTSTGAELSYVAYLGGSGDDRATSIAVDSSGSTYITGLTASTDFAKVTPFQNVKGLDFTDAFVTKLNPEGSALVYSTYLGGELYEEGTGIAVDKSGNAYVAGFTGSVNFPRVRPMQPAYGGGFSDGFVAKFNASGSSLIYSTYLGGKETDESRSLAVDDTGSVYITGLTDSSDFPTLQPSQPVLAGFNKDVFVAKLNPEGSGFVYSTYWGGRGNDVGLALAVDSSGNAYVTGATEWDFPTVNPFQSGKGGSGSDAFVAKLGRTGTVIFSTYFGGSDEDQGLGIAVDGSGRVHFTGYTDSWLFPLAEALQARGGWDCRYGQCRDAFMATLEADGSSLVYSTRLGGNGLSAGSGIAVDSAGSIYVAGGSEAFKQWMPVPFQGTSSHGRSDAFLLKIRLTEDSGQKFSISERGGISLRTEDTGPASIGFARILPNPPYRTPAGLAVIGLRQNGVLVSETAIPAVPFLSGGRIYAEVGPSVNTALVIANPHVLPASVSFSFSSGIRDARRTVVVPPNSQIARFLDQPPFSSGSSMDRLFVFESSAPVAVAALRTLVNERSEFLMAALPLYPLEKFSAGIPEFADGQGWSTQVVLINPSSTEVRSGKVKFMGQGSGVNPPEPVAVTIGGKSGDTFDYVLLPESSQRFQTSGSSSVTRVGSIRFEPDFSSPVSAYALLVQKNNGVTVSETVVPAVPFQYALRVYVERTGNLKAQQPGSVESGVALIVSDGNRKPVNVNFELTTLQGNPTGIVGTLSLPDGGQAVMLLQEIPGFDLVPAPFRGVLRISSASFSGIAAVGLRARYNERGDLLVTSVPAIEERDYTLDAELLFPHWASGGGYTTEFILFNALRGRSASGWMRFFDPIGRSVNLNLR